jgi:hypothetical protein
MALKKMKKKLPNMYYDNDTDVHGKNMADFMSEQSGDQFKNADYDDQEGTKPSAPVKDKIAKLRRRGAPVSAGGSRPLKDQKRG